MKLAKNEKIIKRWDYADTKQGATVVHSRLTVTNERIVSENEGTYSSNRKEIPISSVKTISSSTRRNSNVLGIVLIFLGVLMAILPFALGEQFKNMIIYTVGIVIGAVIVIVGISLLNRGAFTLIITTQGVENTAMTLGRSNLLATKTNGDRVKIKITREVVEDMLDTIGAVVIDVRNGNFAKDEDDSVAEVNA